LCLTEDQRTVLEKSIKQLNNVSISVSLGLGLVLGLVLGLMPSSDIVLKSTVLSSSCVPSIAIKKKVRRGRMFVVCWHRDRVQAKYRSILDTNRYHCVSITIRYSMPVSF